MQRPDPAALPGTVRADEVVERIIWCAVADTLRYRRSSRFGERLRSWLRARAGQASGPYEDDLAAPDVGLCVIGPGVGREVKRWLRSGTVRPPVLDLSGQGLGQAFRDPRRRALDESWFTIAKSAAEIVLEAVIEAAPAPWSDTIRTHRLALLLRLKTDIGLRLRRLEIVAERAADLGAKKVLLIEGDQPLDDLEAHFLSSHIAAECLPGPGAQLSIERRAARRTGASRRPGPAWSAFAAEVARWAPPALDFKGQALVTADLRRKRDFRHSRTACDLLAALAPGDASLLQPYTRITWNVRRAAATVDALGVRMNLLRQPQATGFVPALASVRSVLLSHVDDALRRHGPFSTGERAAILEATGGFIASNLAPSVALAEGLRNSFERSRPRFVASVPLGSPFGGLVVSAARAAGTPTVEIQTLMIGQSDRDPTPVAERIAVLDTSQRDIFAARFGVEAGRFILAGHVELGGETIVATSPGRTVLFASQPLEGVAADALALLAEACVRLGAVRLTLAPHPDETSTDIDAYRSVLARWPQLEVQVAEPGQTPALIGDNAVLATVLSNVALRAAVIGRPVLMLDPGIETPLDFERLGLACKARTPTEAATLLADFFADGSAARTLALSRAAYFSANPQLLQPGAVDRIIRAMDPDDEYWRTGAPSS